MSEIAAGASALPVIRKIVDDVLRLHGSPARATLSQEGSIATLQIVDGERHAEYYFDPNDLYHLYRSRGFIQFAIEFVKADSDQEVVR